VKRLVLAIATTAALIAPAGAATAATTTGAEGSAALNQTLVTARQVSEKYHDLDAAVADGYVPASGCVELPGVGGMGVHYLNPSYAADPAIRADQPEELLYEPRSDGSLQLVGVEYFRADADQDLSTDDDRPSLDGVAFDGPMLGHGPGMPIHYDLHVWVWKANPAGTFAEWNPNVHC
jgi:hypothetical protein